MPHPSNRWLRRDVRFRYEPVSCGVRLTFPTRAGDTLEYSAFMRGTKRDVSLATGMVTDATQQITTNPAPQAVSFEGGYASAADPRLVRARMRFQPQTAQDVSVTVCSR
jgi:hypothetical protein